MFENEVDTFPCCIDRLRFTFYSETDIYWLRENFQTKIIVVIALIGLLSGILCKRKEEDGRPINRWLGVGCSLWTPDFLDSEYIVRWIMGAGDGKALAFEKLCVVVRIMLLHGIYVNVRFTLMFCKKNRNCKFCKLTSAWILELCLKKIRFATTCDM